MPRCGSCRLSCLLADFPLKYEAHDLGHPAGMATLTCGLMEARYVEPRQLPMIRKVLVRMAS